MKFEIELCHNKKSKGKHWEMTGPLGCFAYPYLFDALDGVKDQAFRLTLESVSFSLRDELRIPGWDLL